MSTRDATLGPVDRSAARPWWLLGLGASGAAALVNAILSVAYQAIAGSPLQVTPPGRSGLEDLDLGFVLLTSLLPPLVGAALAAALDRWVRSGRTWFIAISVAFVLLSLASPLTLPGASLANKLVLAIMHLVVAGFTITVLAPRFGSRHATTA